MATQNPVSAHRDCGKLSPPIKTSSFQPLKQNTLDYVLTKTLPGQSSVLLKRNYYLTLPTRIF